jgi:hypothetical protein
LNFIITALISGNKVHRTKRTICRQEFAAKRITAISALITEEIAGLTLFNEKKNY